MPLVFLRIDDRLIHGQVVEGWIPFLKAKRVVVVCDEAASDPTQRALMRMALPPEVGLDILLVADAARHPGLKPENPEKTLLLVPGPHEALSLVKAGVRISPINVGGRHYTAGRVQLGKAVFLSAADQEAFREISLLGVKLEGRAVPSERPIDILERIGAVEAPS